MNLSSTKRTSHCFGALLFSLGLAVAASAQTTYYFWQAGWEGGGVLSGTFTGADLDNDGQLTAYSQEITNFSVSLQGNSLVSDFTITNGGLWGFVFDLSGGPFLGDGLTGGVEGIGAASTEGAPIVYTTGHGPNGFNGGMISYDGAFVMTEGMVMLSTTPITPESYQAALTAFANGVPATDITNSPIPEPSTYALIAGALGLVGAVVHRRRRRA